MKIYSMDGKLLPAERAGLPVNDLAFTRGYAAFDAMRTYQRVPFLVKEHIRRLLRTARIMRIPHTFSAKKILENLKKTLAANPAGEKLIRIYITAGDGHGLGIHGQARLLILVDDFTPPPANQITRGVSLMTYKYLRPTPLAKSTNYTEAVLATIMAKKKKFDEAVFVNNKSELTEGTTYNIIAQTSAGWIIPSEGLLPGITLQTITRLLKKSKQQITFRNIKLSELTTLKGLFITSSNREILPVRRIDKIPIKISNTSQNTSLIFQHFRSYVDRYTAANQKFWK